MAGPQTSQALANLFLSLFGQKNIPTRQRESYAGMRSALSGMGGGGMQMDPRMMMVLDEVARTNPGRALMMAQEIAYKGMQPTEVPTDIQNYNFMESKLPPGTPPEEIARIAGNRPRTKYNVGDSYTEEDWNNLGRATMLGTGHPETSGFHLDELFGGGKAKRDDFVRDDEQAARLKEIQERGAQNRETAELEAGLARTQREEARERAQVEYAVNTFSDPLKLDTAVQLHNNVNFLRNPDRMDMIFDLYESGWFPGVKWDFLKFRGVKGIFSPNEYNDLAAQIDQVIQQLSLPKLKAMVGSQGITEGEGQRVQQMMTTLGESVSGKEAMRQIILLSESVNHITDRLFQDAVSGGIRPELVEIESRRLARRP